MTRPGIERRSPGTLVNTLPIRPIPLISPQEQDATSLNSALSFFHSKVKELCLPDYLPIVRGRITGFIPFPCLLGLCPGFELWPPCLFPMMITITPQATILIHTHTHTHTHICIYIYIYMYIYMYLRMYSIIPIL